VSQSTLEFLAWVARCPRTYAETMEAWQTTCPRNSVWEDAIGDSLIRLESGDGRTTGEARVTLTLRGRAMLDGARLSQGSSGGSTAGGRTWTWQS
jgi:hypothetical protein